MSIARAEQRSIDEEYRAKLVSSHKLYQEAVGVFPSGVTHDIRYLEPFPIYVVRASGSKKWDVDGHEYIDYLMGHGALLLGHSHPAVVAAVSEQIQKGTHYGACHELEIEWGKLVQKLVPSAQKVKFTSSGTEATLMALRLARAYTGRAKVLKFESHFHGWHDYATLGVTPPFEVPASLGVPSETLRTIVQVPPNDIAAVEAQLKSGEFAAVILEPTGGSWGTVPTRPGFLQELREVTRQHGVVLIFDEVITGFRWAPGGAQEYYSVTPDLTALAKIVAGGLPGGAVAGRADIMALLEFKDAHFNRYGRIAHPGTYNANPLAAAAGVAALRIVGTGEPQAIANQRGAQLRKGMNATIGRLGLPGCVYGEASTFHIFVGPNCPITVENDQIRGPLEPTSLMRGMGELRGKLRRAMLLYGVDLMGAGGMLSAAHTEEDVAKTTQAFERTLRRLVEERDL